MSPPSVRLASVEFDRAMVVFAHPDDGEFGSAGTVASWTRQGTEVAYVCVTDGSAGSNEPGVVRDELAEVRQAEQRAACDVLGVEDCVFLGIPDGMVEVNRRTSATAPTGLDESDTVIADNLLRVRPGIPVTVK